MPTAEKPTSDIDELFARVAAGLDDADDDGSWHAIATLHRIGSSEVLERAIALTADESPRLRGRGVAILGQLGIPERSFPDACFAAIAPLAVHAEDAEVLAAAIFALGHLQHTKATQLMVSQIHHESAEIRYAVAVSLGGCSEPAAIEALIKLTRDEDEDVRDWATFGLGETGEVDTPDVRDALFARLQDPHRETRYEAICGLARCCDARVLPLMIKVLKDNPKDDSLDEHAKKWLELSDETTDREDLIRQLERLRDNR